MIFILASVALGDYHSTSNLTLHQTVPYRLYEIHSVLVIGIQKVELEHLRHIRHDEVQSSEVAGLYRYPRLDK